ncbi:MAG: polysaccharide deacetylase family protein [Gammaproteobacteria bacterium]|nr:polysaccharide deacetylase family protein [Gammaproteobacteria bacterium]
MKKHSASKILWISLSFIGLFFYDACYLNLALANPEIAADPVKLEPDSTIAPNETQKKYLASMLACRGIRKAHTTKKVVALTFDDGPSKKYTSEIFEILRINNIKATFFVVGKNAAEYPKVIKEAYQDGNIIGNHTYSHSNLSRLDGEDIDFELSKNSNIIHKLIGVYPTFFRPPYGICSDKSRRVAKNLGLKTIMWNDMVDDYHVNRTTPEKIASEIIELVTPGAIIGLHDGGGNRGKTVAALPIIIASLKNQGYLFLSLSELLDIPAYISPRNEPVTH